MKPVFSRSSSLLGELCARRSHSSFLRTKAESTGSPSPPTTLCSPPLSLSTFLLPQLFCLRRTTPSGSGPVLADLGAALGVWTDLGRAPPLPTSLLLLARYSTSSMDSWRPIPSLEPAGLAASSITVSSSGVRAPPLASEVNSGDGGTSDSGLVSLTTSSTAALTTARLDSSSSRSSWLEPVLARLSCELTRSFSCGESRRGGAPHRTDRSIEPRLRPS